MRVQLTAEVLSDGEKLEPVKSHFHSVSFAYARSERKPMPSPTMKRESSRGSLVQRCCGEVSDRSGSVAERSGGAACEQMPRLSFCQAQQPPTQREERPSV